MNYGFISFFARCLIACEEDGAFEVNFVLLFI